MAYSIEPLSGINLVSTTTTNPNSAGTEIPTFGPLGTQVFGSDGKRYVFAQAGAAVTASTATCSINASTFVVTASGGSYTSPAVTLASGDYAWFAATSV
jgi:hypothetical protein